VLLKGVKYIFLISLYIVLCCPFCTFLNKHKDHKVLALNDEESLKKENITIENEANGLDEMIKKSADLKGKIEKEILAIDELYDKINKEVIESFKKKHEELIQKENYLKEKLKIEVTTIKEKLEKFLSESKKVIESSEKILKGIKNLETEKEKNMIKILSYVSKINSNKKQMESLIQEPMKSLRITFQKEKNVIKFDDCYFNGTQIPKDIEVKNISDNSFEVFWKIDNNKLKIFNSDNKQIKFKVEIRKENENFHQIYEGDKNNCLVEKLSSGSNYEMRICSFYDTLYSEWTEIQKVKTIRKEFNESIILNESERKNEFVKIIYEWIGHKEVKLIYRASRDGTTGKHFHKKCDNQGPTICLYKNNKGNIFGGYASISWKNEGGFVSAKDSFIFTLTNIHGIKPTKFINYDINKSVYHDSYYLSNFYDICIFGDFKKDISYSYFPTYYADSTGKGKSIFTSEFNNNDKNMKIIEIEVFKIISN